MTFTNPYPLANPFNQSRFKNFAYGQAQSNSHFSINKTSNPKDLTVPEAKSFYEIMAIQQQVSQLTVPNSDIPYYNGPIPVSGFLGQSSLFKLSDGSVIDMKKCKIIFDPNKKWLAHGYWNNPNASMKKLNTDKNWHDGQTIESMLTNIGKSQPIDDPNLSPESIAYWNKANEESKRLEQNLTDEQKKLLDDLHSGKLFPLSKLIDEK